MKRFFWWLAGANGAILDQCPADQNRYLKVGLTILLTGIIAGFTGGFAIYTSFDRSLPAGIAAGILWAIVIINLDSLIVSSMRDNGPFAQKLRNAAIRIVLSLFIGLVIAHPFELHLFDEEIRDEMVRIKMEEHESLAQKQVTADSLLKAGYEKQRNALDTLIAGLDEKITCLQQAIQAEGSGKEGEFCGIFTSGTLGQKKLFEQLNTQLQYEQDRRAEKMQSRAQLDSMILAIQGKIDLARAPLATIREEMRTAPLGLLARHHALMSLTRSGNGKGRDVARLSFFITLLIIFIELSPVIVKLMQTGSRYDRLVQEFSDPGLEEEQYRQLARKYPQLRQKINEELAQALQQDRVLYGKMLEEEKQVAALEDIRTGIQAIRTRQELDRLKIEHEQTLGQQLALVELRLKQEWIEALEARELQALLSEWEKTSFPPAQATKPMPSVLANAGAGPDTRESVATQETSHPAAALEAQPANSAEDETSPDAGPAEGTGDAPDASPTPPTPAADAGEAFPAENLTGDERPGTRENQTEETLQESEPAAETGDTSATSPTPSAPAHGTDEARPVEAPTGDEQPGSAEKQPELKPGAGPEPATPEFRIAEDFWKPKRVFSRATRA